MEHAINTFKKEENTQNNTKIINSKSVVKTGIIGGSVITGLLVHKKLNEADVPPILSLSAGALVSIGLASIGYTLTDTVETYNTINRIENETMTPVDIGCLLAQNTTMKLEKYCKETGTDTGTVIKDIDVDELLYHNETMIDDIFYKSPIYDNDDNPQSFTDMTKQESTMLDNDIHKLFEKRLKNDETFGKDLWPALTNVVWYNKYDDNNTEYHYSFQEAGSLIASMVEHGDYSDWVCSDSSGIVNKSIGRSMANKGWKYRIIAKNDKNYEEYPDVETVTEENDKSESSPVL